MDTFVVVVVVVTYAAENVVVVVTYVADNVVAVTNVADDVVVVAARHFNHLFDF